MADLAYQARALEGVSRTFALTIPQLPPGLRDEVGNAYLLCRIADTIEDEPGLDAAAKERHAERFVAALEGRLSAREFSAALLPLLSGSTLVAEHDLVANADTVLRVTGGFGTAQRAALARCVRVMSRGMAEFQRGATTEGLATLSQLDRYCYHVAGVVGEMLTELFCEHSPEIAARRDELRGLAVSFGQGLQMTNILKDVWEDRERGACWLPRDVMLDAGFDLAARGPDGADPCFRAGMLELLAIARMHLRNALRYTLLLPPSHAGLRRFCLWALGMAVLTLRRIHARPAFTRGEQVKISRASVRATVAVTSLAVRRDTLLTWMFDAFTAGLPTPSGRYAEGLA